MKQIIVLDLNPNEGGLIAVNVLFWFAVAVDQRVPLEAGQSPYQNASPDELNAIKDGSVLQEQHNFRLPASLELKGVQDQLTVFYTDRSNYLASIVPKGKFHGAIYEDGQWIGKA